jgi:DNA replication and repair protein RecF
MGYRARVVEKLARISEGIHEGIADGAQTLEVGYEPSIESPEAIADILRERRGRDREAGSTTAGPHKDDIRLRIGDIDLRRYGSQGQQRTAALALKLAEVEIIREETGEMPILLLDDVLSELDEGRQRRLLGSFEDCQIIITTAELSQDLEEAFPAAMRIAVE